MSINFAAEAGSAQLRQFTVISNNSLDVSLLGGVVELYIYQSCLDTTVRASATITDTGYRGGNGTTAAFEQDDLDLTAGEKVTIRVEDGYGNILSFLNQFHLRIQQLRNLDGNTSKNIFTIDMYSKESIDNELVDTRVNKRFDGFISDSISTLLSDFLKTEKNIFIDKTANRFNFLGNNEKPFYKIPWLATRSVPDVPNANGKLAGYFFYETADNERNSGGYHFKSIDRFFEQRPKYKLIYNNTPFLPTGYDKKIISYSINSSVNLDNVLRTGALTMPVLKTFNKFSKEYKEEKLFSDVERLDPKYMGGISPPQIAKDLDLWNKSTKIFTKFDPIGILPTGSNLETQLQDVEKKDWNPDEILRQSTARYNNLFNTRLNIVIPGDFSIFAGDILECDFPEISSKVSKIISNKKSGRYLVIDVAHNITKNHCYTSLNLVRESIYKS